MRPPTWRPSRVQSRPKQRVPQSSTYPYALSGSCMSPSSCGSWDGVGPAPRIAGGRPPTAPGRSPNSGPRALGLAKAAKRPTKSHRQCKTSPVLLRTAFMGMSASVGKNGRFGRSICRSQFSQTRSFAGFGFWLSRGLAPTQISRSSPPSRTSVIGSAKWSLPTKRSLCAAVAGVVVGFWGCVRKRLLKLVFGGRFWS